MRNASVEEFNSQRNKLPGDRENIASIDKYILELYTDPLGQKDKAVIEVNHKTAEGDYEKIDSIWFNPQGAGEREFENPLRKAKERFDELKVSTRELESEL